MLILPSEDKVENPNWNCLSMRVNTNSTQDCEDCMKNLTREIIRQRSEPGRKSLSTQHKSYQKRFCIIS